MKFRIKENSIRVRLTRRELAELDAIGSIAESTSFSPANRLDWRLSVDGTATRIRAEFNAGTITVFLPTALLQQWLDPQCVSLSETQTIGAEPPLLILLEKDFACLTDRAGEDESDAFPRSVNTEPACPN